jgi:flagellin-like protein
MKYMKNKRGLSPVITTVMLIAIVIVLAAIILMWARYYVPESITKDGKNIESVCQEVAFEATYKDTSGSLDEIIVSNNGNVDIYSFEVLLEGNGVSYAKEVMPQDIATGNELAGGLKRGASANMSIDVNPGTIKMTVVPYLLGESGEKEEKYLCKNHPGEQIL